MSVPDLDPQIIEVLRTQEEAGLPPVEELGPQERAANYAALAQEQFGEVDEMHAVEDRDADGVPVRVYRPVETRSRARRSSTSTAAAGWSAASRPTTGLPRARQARRLRRRLGRLPARPRAPLPGRARGRLDGGALGARERRRARARPGADRRRRRQRGGTLAAIVARKGRDGALPFAAQLLLYPTTTSRTDAPSYSLFSSGYGLTRDAMRWYWRQYLGDVGRIDEPRHLTGARSWTCAGCRARSS